MKSRKSSSTAPSTVDTHDAVAQASIAAETIISTDNTTSRPHAAAEVSQRFRHPMAALGDENDNLPGESTGAMSRLPSKTFRMRRGMQTSGRSWRMPCSKSGRMLKWLSDGEHFAHLLALFDPRVIDIRDQHILPADEVVAICGDLGIAVPTFAGGIAELSVDLLLTLSDHDGRQLKPVEVKKDRAGFERHTDTLAIKRVWAKGLGAELCEMAKTDVPLQVVKNLRNLRRAVIQPSMIASPTMLSEFARGFRERLQPGATLRHGFASPPKGSVTELDWMLFFQCVWFRLLPADLRHPIVLDRPFVTTTDSMLGVRLPW